MAKTITGIVTSSKPDKTIVVTVRSRKTHPLYKKQYSVSTKFMAHDEKNEAQEGDKVTIIMTRPLSARKRFTLREIIEKPVLRDKDTRDIVKGDETEKPRGKARSDETTEETA